MKEIDIVFLTIVFCICVIPIALVFGTSSHLKNIASYETDIENTSSSSYYTNNFPQQDCVIILERPSIFSGYKMTLVPPQYYQQYEKCQYEKNFPRRNSFDPSLHGGTAVSTAITSGAAAACGGF